MKDPLLDTVGILESNWRNVRNVLQRTHHVLPHLFVGLFPKEKKDMPTGNLRRLVEAFDTLEDPTLQLKLSSVRRGAEGTVALALSHGEVVDWDKVSSSHARCLICCKCIYNFLCSMLVLHQLLYVLFTLCGIFMHFLELTY
jgi:hypothetical protein